MPAKTTQETERKALLPCPLCGGGATISHFDNSGKYTMVNCIVCGCNTGKRLRSFDAVNFWQARARLGKGELESITKHPQWLAVRKEEWEAEQILGKALGYPWYKDDQKNFAGCTESDGVCTGEHTLVTLAIEASRRITALSTPAKPVEVGAMAEIIAKAWSGDIDMSFSDCVDASAQAILAKYNVTEKNKNSLRQ